MEKTYPITSIHAIFVLFIILFLRLLQAVKLIYLFLNEFSKKNIGQILIQSLLYYTIMLISLNLLGDSPLSELTKSIQILAFIAVFNTLLLFSLIPDYFQDDLKNHYTSWFQNNDSSLRSYFFIKLLAGLTQFILPITCISLLILLMSSLSLNYFAYTLGIFIYLTTLLAWGCFFQILIGNSFTSLQNTLQPLLTLPILIPLILVSSEFMKALAHNDHWEYYLGMQIGLCLMSITMTLAFIPIIARHLED